MRPIYLIVVVVIAAGCATYSTPTTIPGSATVPLETLIDNIAEGNLPKPWSYLEIQLNRRGEAVTIRRRGDHLPDDVETSMLLEIIDDYEWTPIMNPEVEIRVRLCGRGWVDRSLAVDAYGKIKGENHLATFTAGNRCDYEVILPHQGPSAELAETVRGLLEEVFSASGSHLVGHRSGTFFAVQLMSTEPAN